MNMSYDSSNLTTPDIKWLGVRPSDLDRFNIPEQCRLPMTEEDMKTGKRLVGDHYLGLATSIKHSICTFDFTYDTYGNSKFPSRQGMRANLYDSDTHWLQLQMEEDFVKANPLWVTELEIMVQSKVKAEIQALSSFGFQYLSQVYLPLKLQEGDWI